MILRATKFCLLGVAAGLIALSILLVGMVVRLAYGPIAMGFLTPTLERAFGGDNDAVHVRIDRTVLAWAGWAHTLDLRIEGVEIVGGDGFVAGIPAISVTLSALAAMRGRLAPSGLEFIGPDVVLARDRAGGIDVGFGDDGSGVNRTDLGDLFRYWLHGAPGGGPLEYLRRITIVDADLEILDAGSGANWRANRAHLAIRRHTGGLAGTVSFAIDIGSNEMPVKASIDYRRDAEIADIKIETGQFHPAWLASSAPEFPMLGTIDVPIAIAIDMTADLDGRIGASELSIEGGGGYIAAPEVWVDPIPVFELSVAGRIDHGFRETETLFDDPLSQSALTGKIAISLPDGDAAFPLDIAVRHEPGEPTLAVDIDLYNLRPDKLARGLARIRSDLLPPVAAPYLQAAEIPINGRVSLDLDLRGRPQRVWVAAEAGAGHIVLPTLFDRPLPLGGAEAELMYDLTDGEFAISPLALRIGAGAVTVYATGQGGDRGEILLAAHATDIAATDLIDWWPYPVAEDAGLWVAHNISAGTVAAADIWVGATRNDEEIAIRDIRGQIDIDDATVGYLLPMPAATNVYATGDITERALRIAIEQGLVNGVRISGGDVRIWDLSADDHEIEIEGRVAGPLKNLLEVIDTPPYSIVSEVDISPADAAGEVEGTMRFAFPLLADLLYEDIDMRVDAKVTGGALRDAALGVDLTAASLDIDLKAQDMTVTGAGRFAGAPIVLTWQERLIAKRSEFPFRSRLQAFGAMGEEARATMGFAFLNEYITGPVRLDAEIVNREPGHSRVRVKAGLEEASIDLAPVSWSKPPERPATFEIDGVLTHRGNAPRLTEFSFRGAGPEFVASGKSRMNAAGDALERTVFDRVAMGRTNLHNLVIDQSVAGRVTFVADGAMLDIEPYFTGAVDPVEPGAEPPGETWSLEPAWPFKMGADLNIDAIRFGDGRLIRDFDAVMLHDGIEWRKFAGKGLTGDGKWAKIDYLRGRERDELIAWFDDFGAFMRIANIADNINGGTMAITGAKDTAAPDSPMNGRFEMRDYRLLDAPTLANLLSVASLTGILDALSAEDGMFFSRMEGRYGYSQNILTLEKVRAFSASLGVTANGALDLGAGTLDIDGTFAPAYLLSQILGSIPIVGDILAGANGEGLFAANVDMTGRIEDPDISVNPLSALAPGILRNLFDGAADQTAADPDAYLGGIRQNQ